MDCRELSKFSRSEILAQLEYSVAGSNFDNLTQREPTVSRQQQRAYSVEHEPLTIPIQRLCLRLKSICDWPTVFEYSGVLVHLFKTLSLLFTRFVTTNPIPEEVAEPSRLTTGHLPNYPTGRTLHTVSVDHRRPLGLQMPMYIYEFGQASNQ